MRVKLIASSLATITALTGCASIQESTGLSNKTVSTSAGITLGCAGGALMAKLLNRDVATGCMAGAAVGGLIGFEKARQEEIDEAEKTSADVMNTMATIPAGKGVVAEKTKTIDVETQDASTKSVKKVKTFSSITIDLPLTAKGTPEFDTAIEKIKAFATKLADKRGSADITLAVSPKSAAKYQFTASKDSVKTEAGNTINVIKKLDQAVPQGIERITVSAPKPEQPK